MSVAVAADLTAETRLALAWRFRVVVSCLVLVALSFVQKPGMLVGDTKLDLATDPGGLLQRAVHMWDPEGAFGQVQNQAYGYLFPMGPFFWVGHQLDVPGWAMQRAWLSLVLVVGFLGIVKLTGVLGLGSPLSRIVAGFAFALSPRLLTTLGPISIEAWPSAVAPWVLVPLVIGAQRGSPRRAAALSALAVACVGGVNAAATAAVLPLGAVWLLTRTAGRRRRTMMLFWPVFTLLGTLWWLVPLFLLGRYSPPFLDFIESASITTFPTTLYDSLRGASHWVPYIEPGWVAGHHLVTDVYLILDVAAIVGLGLMGLARVDNPHRQFLVLGLLTGMVLVTAGHLGDVQGWFASFQRDWLDGVLAPARNVHKFDPVVRLPLVLGLAHLLGVLGRRVGREARDVDFVGVAVSAVAVIALVGSATPALAGQLTPSGEFRGVPDYWAQAADWLGRHRDGTTALLLPGSSFGSYVWGEPRDEPMQYLARSPWAVRNAIPLAPPGNIRLLSALEARVASGNGSPALTATLARSGIGYLVVRNDLERSSDVPDPVVVHQALNNSPGLVRVASFGPVVGGDARLDSGRRGRVTVNRGWQDTFPALEIYAVPGATAAVTAGPPVVVAGGPENLLDLTEMSLVGGEPTVLAPDLTGRPDDSTVILTDGLRRRSADFGRTHQNLSHTLGEGEKNENIGTAREYVLDGGSRWTTTAVLLGAKALRASSSMSDASVPGAIRPEQAPYAAFDNDAQTSWVSGYDNGATGPWLEFELDRPALSPRLKITRGDEAGRDERKLVISTNQGTVLTDALGPGDSFDTVLPKGPTHRVRISLQRGPGSFGARLAVADVLMSGLRVSRPLRLPSLPRGWGDPDTVLMAASDGYSTGCVEVDGDTRCAPGRSSLGEDRNELDRILTLNQDAVYRVRMRATPRPGEGLDELIQDDLLVQAHASSRSVSAPMGGPIAAIDGDPGTTWIADDDDVRPTLTVSWLREQTLRGLTLRLNESAAAVRPRRVEIVAPEGRRTAEVGVDGKVSFEPLRTDGIQVWLLDAEQGSDIAFDETVTRLPMGISELVLDGSSVLPVDLDVSPRLWACGSGPDLVLRGEHYSTALVGSRRQLYAMEPVESVPCHDAELEFFRGDNRLSALATPAVRAQYLVLTHRSVDPVGSARAPELAPTNLNGPTRRLVYPGASGATLVVRANENDGWRATVDGKELTPVTVDGWQQGWSFEEPSAERVALEYMPDRLYRAGLLGGVVAFGLLLLAIGWWPDRRGVLSEAVYARPLHRLSGSLLAVLASGVLAGWWGAGITAVAVAATLRWRGRAEWLFAPWLLLIPFSGATLLYALSPWGDPSGWAGSMGLPQLFVALTLALLSVGVLVVPGRAFSRRNGFSTSR